MDPTELDNVRHGDDHSTDCDWRSSLFPVMDEQVEADNGTASDQRMAEG